MIRCQFKRLSSMVLPKYKLAMIAPSLPRLYSTGRIRDGGRNFLYGGVILGTASLFGGLLYLVGKDLFFPGGTYDVIDKAVEKIEANPQLVQMLGGLPLKVYGHTGNRGRRRPAVHESLMSDGAKCIETSFFVEGPTGIQGRVSLQMIEGEDGGWRERYFAVEVEGFAPQILVQPPAKPREAHKGWHPLNRIFS